MPPPAQGLVSHLLMGPALRTQPDRRLVALVREGYEAAFEEIVRRYRQPLGRYAAAIVGIHSEDITQDAFSKALLALRRDNREIELRPWLYRIVRNTALNDLRDRPAAAEQLAETIAGGPTPAEATEQREQLANLINGLHALPESQRAAIVMRELEGLGHDEIAGALGLSGGGARQAIYRARLALRDAVGGLIPPSLLKAVLSAGGSGAAGAAAGTAGVGGAGIALKAAGATLLVAGAVGAGVAIHHSTPAGRAGADGSGGALAQTRGVPPADADGPQQPAGSSGRSTGTDHRGGGGRPVAPMVPAQPRSVGRGAGNRPSSFSPTAGPKGGGTPHHGGDGSLDEPRPHGEGAESGGREGGVIGSVGPPEADGFEDGGELHSGSGAAGEDPEATGDGSSAAPGADRPATGEQDASDAAGGGGDEAGGDGAGGDGQIEGASGGGHQGIELSP